MANDVSRRGFLGALTAFTAAAASGAQMVPSWSGKPALPCQSELLASLSECRVVEHIYSLYAFGQHPNTYTVRFVHAPDAPLTSLDENARAHMRGMVPISVTQVRDENGRKEVTVVLA